MASRLHSIIYIDLIILLFINVNPIYSISEKDYLKRIKSLALSGNREELAGTSKKFYKKYPKSKYIPDVRLILADNEIDPVKAIHQYGILVDKYRYYPGRDSAEYKLCRILYLLSRWTDLRDESLKGIKLFNRSKFLTQFKLLLAKACIHLEKYDEAKKVCLGITGGDHDYESLAESLLLLSYINKKSSGYSRSYIQNLKELIAGFNKSKKMPIIIYLLGKYYEAKSDYNRAYSAYIDILKKFPKAPESEFAKRRLDNLNRYRPVKTDYIPDNKIFKNIDKIDIQPDIDLVQEDEGNSIYSISLGFFSNIKEARRIKNLIKRDFHPVRIIKARGRFFLYVGKLKSSESAISTKIRLAEEFGLNGKIVRILEDEKRQYIYDE